MAFTSVQITILAGLFVVFLAVPMLTQKLGSALDSLPMRIGAALLILAALPYDKFIALGIFIVVAALYAQHHTDSVKSILGPQGDTNPLKFDMPFQTPPAVEGLQKGGHTDVSYDEMDFMPKSDDQTDQFAPVGESIDMKHALETEPLGSKAQRLFPEDAANADYLMRDSANGSRG
jgi:hypothetical protein